MFTGLIEAVGRTGRLTETATGRRVAIETVIAADLIDGESVSVNGVCLTVARRETNIFYADIGPETARVTTLGTLTPGQSVNLERAMRADSRFGGHFVQGHVDGMGTVREVRADGDARWIRIAFSPELAPFFVLKGSVAVDGVSLTVAGLGERQFDVMVIPFTWSHTTLKALRKGDKVNIECDMIGKYAARAMELRRAQ